MAFTHDADAHTIQVRARPVRDDLKILDIEGELDLSVVAEVKDRVQRIMDRGIYNFIVNLEDVRYIDSAGLGFLLGLMRNVKEHAGQMVLHVTRAHLLRVFAVTGLDRVFTLYPTEEMAIGHFNRR